MTYLDDVGSAIRNELADELIPEDADDLFRLYAVLLRVKGAATTGSDVHDAWAAWMQTRNPRHTAIAPYGELSRATQDEDRPFLEAIRRVAARFSA